MDGGKQRFSGGLEDKTIINQIMLRFRPIAPRPEKSTSSSAPGKDAVITKKRVKRKYVRVKKKKASCSVKDNDGEWLDGTVTMLQLLPEREVTVGENFSIGDPVEKLPCWIDFGTVSGKNKEGGISLVRSRGSSDLLHDTDRMAAAAAAVKVVIESCLTMERVTDTCEDGGGRRWWLGCTDEERAKNLEGDTCPGFISNSLDRVQWINTAYKRMMVDDLTDGTGGEELPEEVVVSLVVKEEEKSLQIQWPAFSCRVRVVNSWGKKTVKMMVPCDVWRMDFGGFAWRLDVEAALSLGR